MSGHPIGKLQRVPLREVWKHEAKDFTQWLQDNIDVLNVALDLNLVNVEREQAAGAFSIDLVAEDEGGGTVIIENQLEKSNHDHLGKLITYLTAMSARVAVWIVSEPRPEHVAAVAWLNESTSADFYLVKVFAAKGEIEKHLTTKPSWERLDGRRACRIRISLKGGYRSPEDDWDDIQSNLVAAMNELEAALRPQLKKLKLGN